MTPVGVGATPITRVDGPRTSGPTGFQVVPSLEAQMGVRAVTIDPTSLPIATYPSGNLTTERTSASVSSAASFRQRSDVHVAFGDVGAIVVKPARATGGGAAAVLGTADGDAAGTTVAWGDAAGSDVGFRTGAAVTTAAAEGLSIAPDAFGGAVASGAAEPQPATRQAIAVRIADRECDIAETPGIGGRRGLENRLQDDSVDDAVTVSRLGVARPTAARSAD